MSRYIAEAWRNHVREYRLHCTENGVFYACRKMIKRDTPQEKRFQRHSDNSVWILETNPLFDKPSCWNELEADCIKALKSLGLTIGAFDVKCQSEYDSKKNKRKEVDFFVIESCSAPSLQEIGIQKYVEQIPIIATQLAIEAGII